MKFLDTNIFLRYLVEPETEIDRQWASDCMALFERAGRGEEALTTSEAIVAEVIFVLTSPRQYGLPPGEACARLRPVLTLRGLHVAHRGLYLRALDILTEYPRLGFEDALSIAIVEAQGHELLSYDGDFDRVPGIHRQVPPSDGSSSPD